MQPIEETDIVVIGAGAAGAVVAARLSEVADLHVTLLEAGPGDRHPYIHIPAGFLKLLSRGEHVWPFRTAPDAATGDREIDALQGRVVGGSGSINGLVYNRGQPGDFDAWAQMGNPGWEYDAVLPFFRRAEAFRGTDACGARGRDGPIDVTEQEPLIAGMDWMHSLCEAFIDGAAECGLSRTDDYNAGEQHGVGYYQRNVGGGRRISTARGYLGPALRRPNLELLTRCVAAKVVFEAKRAVGVEYITRSGSGTRRVIRARRQVVLSAGAINSARLLQISGLGPPGDLRTIGVPVVHDLSGVGQGLRDHYAVRVAARAANTSTINEHARPPRLWMQQARWLLGRPSIIAMSPSIVHVFARSDEELDVPDLQGVFSPASYDPGTPGGLEAKPGMTCGFWVQRPRSTGHVRALSSSPLDNPLVQPGYLSDVADVSTLLTGVKLARRLMRSAPMRRFLDHETRPGDSVRDDDDLVEYIRRNGTATWHFNGTARMGPPDNPMAVVGPRLRVHGVEGLTVADASIMPAGISANTFASTVMIGEKAAHMLKEDLGFAVTARPPRQ